MIDAVLPELIFQLLGENIVIVLLAIAIISAVVLGVRIVPQSEKHVVERFGRLHSVLGPGINLIVPYQDSVAQNLGSRTSAAHGDARYHHGGQRFGQGRNKCVLPHHAA